MLSQRLAELLDPWRGGAPAYASLATGLRWLVLDGRLAVGDRLPSERELAAALAVSRTTVTAAYDVLRAEGYLRSAHGAGSRVTRPAGGPARPDAAPEERTDVLDLTVAALPAPAQLVDAVREAAIALPPLLAGHGLHPFGLPVLREQVATHLSGRGLPTRAEQVLVTGGALHGWNLLLGALTRAGDRVLVEQPTYPGVLDALAARRLRAIALPVSAAGWERPAGPADLVHLTPDGQNPTGLLASTAQRRRLLAELPAARIAVDETFADVVLDGPPPRPLAALDRRVVTLGSMSKAFWAGLRIGWIRADPDLVSQLAQHRAGQDLASPVLDQLVATHLLRHAATILPDRRAHLRRSRDTVLRALARDLPDWRCSSPRAGLALWVELPRPGASRLAAHALDLGLRITPGPRFTLHGTADRHLRLPVTAPTERVDEITGLLARAAARLAAGTTPSHPPARWTA